MNRSTIVVQSAVALWVCCVPAFAQTQWHAVTASLPVYGSCMATYDPSNQRVLVYNGSTSYTWEVDSYTNVWTQLAGLNGSPWFVSEGCVAFDTVRSRMVLFGGFGPSSAPNGDTWEFDGVAWTMLAPSTSPPARFDAAMCYDPIRNVTLLAGGDAGPYAGPTQPLADAWTWNGVTWTQVPGGPSGSSAAAFDSDRGRVVVHAANGTFEWQGSAFAPITSATTPPPRRAAGMVHDPLRQRTVLYGGRGSGVATLGDLWEYDGTDWIQRMPLGVTAPAAHRFGFVFDPVNREVRRIGGIRVTVTGVATTIASLADEQRYGPIAPATLQLLGYGCTAPSVAPWDDLPWLGDTVELSMPVAGPLPFAVFAFGFTPLANAVIVPGTNPASPCYVYVQPDVLLTAPVVNGEATFPLTIPNDAMLLGARLDTQAFDLGTPWPAGNGLTLRIGGR